jgi:hypothetical protein
MIQQIRKQANMKNKSKFSITKMLGEIRYQINLDNIEKYFEEVPSSLTKKIKNAFKSLIIKVAKFFHRST